MRLIDADELVEKYGEWYTEEGPEDGFIGTVKSLVNMLPTIEPKRQFIVIDKTTGKEADEYRIALCEEWAKALCYCDIDGFALLHDGTLLLVDECGRFEYCDPERFEIKWVDDDE